MDRELDAGGNRPPLAGLYQKSPAVSLSNADLAWDTNLTFTILITCQDAKQKPAPVGISS